MVAHEAETGFRYRPDGPASRAERVPVRSDGATVPGAIAVPMQPLVIGVTSHRNLVPGEVERLRALVREFLLRLQTDFPTLPLTVVSALAAGGDQLVAEEALAVGAHLVAPLPLARADYARDFADAAERERFDALCARAIVVEAAQVEDTDDRTPVAARSREWHYTQAGVYVASHCHVLLALWDGRTSNQPGGTAEVVNYYLTGNKPVLVERRRSGCGESLIEDNNQRLAYHVVCSRDSADGTPAPSLAPLQTFWRTGAGTVPGAEPMPASFDAMFARIVEFNADCARHAMHIEAAALHVSRRAAAPAALTQRSPIERSFAVADWLAIHYQHRVLGTMRSMYVLAALMGWAFVLYDGLDQEWMIFVFLALFAVGVTLDRVANRRDWHRKYLDYRALAEGLRVQAYWRRAGLSMTGDAEFAHDNFLQKQDIDLAWIRNVMRAAGLAAASSQRDTDLRGVIDEWVGESGKAGQLHYYERRLVERTRTHRFTSRLGTLSLWTSIAISAFLALFVFRLSHSVQELLVSAMAMLSIVAAVREAYAYRKADKELIKQYRFMRRIFANARTALDRTEDPDRQRDILRALGEAALAEHAEWTLMHRERPLERARM